jgi:hypothetical protein
MDNICKVCGVSFPSTATLHKHISFREKIKIADYYLKFFPRFDLFSKEQIRFKDVEQYFSTYFVSRNNLVKWFEQNYNTLEAKELSKKIVNNRILSKDLKYLFSEVELRSIIAPSIVGLEKIHNQKYEDIITFPLKKKFKYENIQLNPINSNLEIVIDTREQQPFLFKKYNTNLAKLDVGDYTAAEPLYSDIYIERKSREDFFGTFGQADGVKRFEKELVRAQHYGFYLFIIVEKDINECLNYFLSFSSNQYLVEYAFFNMRNIMQKYDNCQFVFAQNKPNAENLCLQILSNQENSIKYDWQYLIDKRII